MPEWLADFSRQYYVPLLDYGQTRGDWLLISSGCGIMMGVMDAEPRFRWCVDVDGVKNKSRLSRWAGWAQHFAGQVAYCGWFSYSDPNDFRQMIAVMKTPPLAYVPFTIIGNARHCATLEEFLTRLDGSANLRCDKSIAAHEPALA